MTSEITSVTRSELKKRKIGIDHDKIAATTESDIRRYMREDGETEEEFEKSEVFWMESRKSKNAEKQKRMNENSSIEHSRSMAASPK